MIMKAQVTFFLVMLPSLGIAQSFDHTFDRAFEKAAKSAVDRGGAVSSSVKMRDKETAKEASKIVADQYKNSGYEHSSAERIAVDKTARAYADIRATLPKHEADIPITQEKLVRYSRSLSRVTVKSSPAGASISINGQPCGKTETSKWLTNDDYRILASLEGYKTQEKIVHPKEGEPEMVVFMLER